MSFQVQPGTFYTVTVTQMNYATATVYVFDSSGKCPFVDKFSDVGTSVSYGESKTILTSMQTTIYAVFVSSSPTVVQLTVSTVQLSLSSDVLPVIITGVGGAAAGAVVILALAKKGVILKS
ncbi:MAG: hypothetical protein ACTSSJ_01900 [Candidatus Odinarchaeia archaeon]